MRRSPLRFALRRRPRRIPYGRQVLRGAAHLGITLTLTCVMAACNRSQPPGGPAPANQNAAGNAAAALTLIPAASADWPAEFAGSQLQSAENGLAAALRLVELGSAAALCRPEPITDATVRLLRLLRLTDEWYAIGFADAANSRRLRAPVLVSVGGQARQVADGAEEEASTLHISADADVFPHLVLLPHRVVILGPEPQTAIELKRGSGLRFSLADEDGVAYVALRRTTAAKGLEVARYTWDPYELQFTGPARDKITENSEAGGEVDVFELDLKLSERLVPRGGLIPKVEPLPNNPPESQPAFEPEGLPT